MPERPPLHAGQSECVRPIVSRLYDAAAALKPMNPAAANRLRQEATTIMAEAARHDERLGIR